MKELLNKNQEMLNSMQMMSSQIDYLKNSNQEIIVSQRLLESQIEAKEQELMRLSQSQASERLPCYKCKGARFSQQGVPCKVCGGSGYSSDHFNAKVQAQIKEYIDLNVPAAYLKLTQSAAAAQLDEPSLDYDEKQRRRLQERQAREILNSMPLGLQKPTQKKEPLDTVFISESFSDNFVVAPSSKVTKQWTLKNTGERFIPKGSLLFKLKEIGGTDTQVNCRELSQNVGANDYFEATVEFFSPTNPGHYRMIFTMRSQFQNFGENIFCDFVVAEQNSQRFLDERSAVYQQPIVVPPIPRSQSSWAPMQMNPMAGGNMFPNQQPGQPIFN